MIRSLVTKLAILGFASTLTAVFIINLCAIVFQCGCASLWNGAAAHCNIHMTAGRHCPWCTNGSFGYKLALGVIIAAQLAVSFWPHSMRTRTRLAAALLAFPALGVVIAVFYGIAAGYWL